ncbi:MAG: DUF2442 domain-containing protein [Bacteroidales bacterium]|nr:DUF2442 domain-containing protein [Bacteroidales bacterium]
MNSTKVIRLINATWLGEYRVELQFDDSVVRQIDFGKFLHNHPHPQHDKYRKLSNFRKFKIERNNIVWGKYWDMDFDLWKLYQGINPL